jgi:multidrug efflux system membrane fusion protein
LKAAFENRDALLWPGQFADVVLRLGVVNATLIPTEAVQPSQQGSFIFRVKPDQTVESVSVTTGETNQGRTQILTGLKPGDIVVTDGHLRLAPGARVKKAADLGALVTQ